MNRRTILFTLTAMIGAYQGSVDASAIHKWIDENGMTHYSDEPPNSAISVIRFEIDPLGYAKSSALQESDRFYSIANQWKRINKERLQRQKLALQQAALKADTTTVRELPRRTYDERSNRNVRIYSRRVYRRHGYNNGRHYLHSYRPGGKPYIRNLRSSGFPTATRARSTN